METPGAEGCDTRVICGLCELGAEAIHRIAKSGPLSAGEIELIDLFIAFDDEFALPSADELIITPSLELSARPRLGSPRLFGHVALEVFELRLERRLLRLDLADACVRGEFKPRKGEARDEDISHATIKEEAPLVALLFLRDDFNVGGEGVDEVARLDDQTARFDDLFLYFADFLIIIAHWN